MMFTPTTFVTANDLFAQDQTKSSVIAEVNAWKNYTIDHAGDFDAFLKTENSAFGGHFALGKYTAPKLVVYGVGGVLLYMLVLKK